MSYTGQETPDLSTTLDGARRVVEDMLCKRNKSGATDSEADFIAGAVTVMDYVFGDGEGSTILPSWFVRLFSGRPVLDG